MIDRVGGGLEYSPPLGVSRIQPENYGMIRRRGLGITGNGCVAVVALPKGAEGAELTAQAISAKI
jgi:hypothetical protein